MLYRLYFLRGIQNELLRHCKGFVAVWKRTSVIRELKYQISEEKEQRTKLRLRQCLAVLVLWAFTLDTYLKGPGPCCLATVMREKGNSRSLYWRSHSQRPSVSLLLNFCPAHKPALTYAEMNGSQTPFLISFIFSCWVHLHIPHALLGWIEICIL